LPLYDFLCRNVDCGTVIEDLVPVDIKEILCFKCQSPAARLVSMPAKTASLWGDSCFGINGTFNRGLGTHITSRAQEDAICKERGLVREADLQTHWHSDNNKRLQDDKAALDKVSNDYHAAVLSHGDDPERHIKACTETFPANEMLAQAAAHDTSTTTI